MRLLTGMSRKGDGSGDVEESEEETDWREEVIERCEERRTEPCESSPSGAASPSVVEKRELIVVQIKKCNGWW